MEHTFKPGETILINRERFTITAVEDCSAYPDQQELTGTRHLDPKFLAGKRTVFTAYLTETNNGYHYDWNGR